jgi:cytoskeletal protein CcmA (bactofilin family)
MSLPRPFLRRRGAGGFTLTLALTLTFLVMVLGMAMLETSQLEMTLAARDSQRILAYNAAEMGIERAAAMAASQKSPWAIMRYNGAVLPWETATEPVYSGNQICRLFTNVDVGGAVPAKYSVVVEDLWGNLYTSGTYRIHGYGIAGPYSRHATFDAQCVTYASFGWLTHNENDVYFRTGDTISGWLYTNDQLHIAGSPIFKGKANSAASSVVYHSSYVNNPQFQGGLYLNSPVVPMGNLVNTNQITLIQTKATQAGVNLPTNSGRPYRTTFNAAGTVLIEKQLSSGSWQTHQTVTLSATNGAIYSPETIQVKGVVNGQVTLAAATGKDIIITGNLTYNYPASPATAFQGSFDLTNPLMNDKMGLIAGRNITIQPPAWSDFGSDVYVMASLCSVSGSFNNYYYTTTPLKTLHILGGIAQQTRGAVGQLSGTGFLKDYKYDSRFVTEPPPHFPTIMYTYNQWRLDP